LAFHSDAQLNSVYERGNELLEEQVRLLKQRGELLKSKDSSEKIFSRKNYDYQTLYTYVPGAMVSGIRGGDGSCRPCPP